MKHILSIFFFTIYILKANILEVNILYLEQKIQKPPVLSNVIEEPNDLGLQGAQVAVKDSNKSARFLNQHFNLIEKISFDKEELKKEFETFIKEGNSYIILNVEDDFLEELISNSFSKNALLINASSENSSLR